MSPCWSLIQIWIFILNYANINIHHPDYVMTIRRDDRHLEMIWEMSQLWETGKHDVLLCRSLMQWWILIIAHAYMNIQQPWSYHFKRRDDRDLEITWRWANKRVLLLFLRMFKVISLFMQIKLWSAAICKADNQRGKGRGWSGMIVIWNPGSSPSMDKRFDRCGLVLLSPLQMSEEMWPPPQVPHTQEPWVTQFHHQAKETGHQVLLSRAHHPFRDWCSLPGVLGVWPSRHRELVVSLKPQVTGSPCVGCRTKVAHLVIISMVNSVVPSVRWGWGVDFEIHVG